MTKTFSKLLMVSCMAVACSAFAAGPTPVQATPGAAATAKPAQAPFLAELKAKLKIDGAAQEKAWEGFTKGSEQQLDMSTFQDMSQAKTTPDLMNSLEKMQSQAAKRFGEQKKAIVTLYDTLDAEQKKTFDAFVFATMAKMGAPAAR